MTRSSRRRALLPLIFVLPALAVLLGLGLWQLERRAWKAGLLAELAAAAAAPPIALPPSLPDPAALSFRRVRLEGRFRHDTPFHYGTFTGPAAGQVGPYLLVPLERAEGPPVLVQRGWIPEAAREAGSGAAPAGAPPISRPEGVVTVEAYVRAPEPPGRFTPANEPARNRWYSIDPEAMAQAAGLPALAPFYVVALDPAAPRQSLPLPAASLPRPPDHHLGYALTWFALALGLIGVYGVYLRHAQRAAPPPARPPADASHETKA
ncbi:MAG: SURF1 family protein [Alphaproteobacteria bacterium]|nr:SURF1 family protein [Alphaproteobacteria bacterium]